METGGVGLVGSDLVVDLNETLLDDEGDLTSSKSVLQTVTDEDLQAKRKWIGLARQPSPRLQVEKLTERGKHSRCLWGPGEGLTRGERCVSN